MTVAASAGHIWGGWCIGTLPDPLSLVGTAATIHPGQSAQGLAYSQALNALTDPNGNGSHATGSVAGTVGQFDFPFGVSNNVAICGGSGSIGPPGTLCPTASPSETLILSEGYRLDVNPHLTLGRPVLNRAPTDSDSLGAIFFTTNASVASTSTDAVIAGIVAQTGSTLVLAAGATTSGSTLSIGSGDAASVQNGYYAFDLTNIFAIANGCTVASGGGTTAPVLSCAVANGGVGMGDTLSFVNPAAMLGRLCMQAADSSTANNQAGTVFCVSGAPSDTNGQLAQLLKTQDGSTLLGVANLDTTTATIAGLQLLTGTQITGILSSYVNFSMNDNAGNPYTSMTFGSAVTGMTFNFGKSGGGNFKIENTPSTVLLTINNSVAAFGVPLQFASSTTGSGTQTFANSPCTALTQEHWIPVQIAGQSGTWYLGACQ